MAIKDSINLVWESLLPLAPHLASLGLGLGIIHKNNYKMHHPLLNKPTFGISCLWNLGNCTFASVASAELLYEERPFLGIELKFSHCGCRGQHLNKVFTQRGKKMQVWRNTVAQKKKLALLWPGLHWKTAEEVVQTSRCVQISVDMWSGRRKQALNQLWLPLAVSY